MDLKVDEPRAETEPETGIYVRAQKAGKWVPVDIAHLTRESLVLWLRSRGGMNLFHERIICFLMGHALEEEA